MADNTAKGFASTTDMGEKKITFSEIGTFGIAEAAMRLDDGAEGIIRLGEVGTGRERHRENLN